MAVKDAYPEYVDYEGAVAEELRIERKRAGISVQQMAGKIGLHSNTIGRCERKELGLGLDMIYAYAKVLGRSVGSLVCHAVTFDVPPTGNPMVMLKPEESIRFSQAIVEVVEGLRRTGIELSSAEGNALTKIVVDLITTRRM